MSTSLHFHALGGMSRRDFVSLSFSALFVMLAFALGRVELATDMADVLPTIDLMTEVVREEKNTPTPQLPKNEPKASPPTSVAKNVVAEKISKVEDSTSSSVSSETSRQQTDKPSPAASAPSVDNRKVDLDGEFENKVRHLIEASKRYPTGREASLQKPQGVVVACLVLQRDGVLQDVRVQKSSTYPLLDNAAKRMLANLHYPAIPDDIYPGHATRSFCVNLDYKTPT